MVYVPQPYVTGTQQNPQQQQRTYNSQSNQPQNNAYGQPGSYGTPSSYSSYGNTTNQTATNTYAPSAASTTSYAPSTSAYGASTYATGAPSAPGGASSYATGAPSAPAPAPMPNFSMALDVPPPAQPATTAPAPAYQSSGGYATDSRGKTNTTSGTTYGNPSSTPYGHPPPTAPYQGGMDNPGSGNTYGNPPAKAPSYQAVAVPVSSVTAVPAGGVTSSTYSGGPTHGIVSEGNPQTCHKVGYEIKGNDMQLVEVELDPQETVIAEASAMMFLEENIDFKVKFGDGATPKEGFFKKLLKAGGRLLTGESLFLTHFTNQGSAKARVAFAAPYPGTIIPVNMADVGGTIICQKDAFLCAAFGTKLNIHFNRKIGSGLFGGEGFILQKLKGDGMAFIHAGGTCIRREMKGETLRLDTGCLVGFSEGITFDIQLVKGLKSMFFGGEGLFLATLQGTGTVWIQSLPFSRMADRIVQSAPSIGGRRQGEGSALMGGFGGLLDGDGH